MGRRRVTAAVSQLAASTRPESLFMTSFFNDWTDGHVAGYQPRSVDGPARCRTGPASGSPSTSTGWARRFSSPPEPSPGPPAGLSRR